MSLSKLRSIKGKISNARSEAERKRQERIKANVKIQREKTRLARLEDKATTLRHEELKLRIKNSKLGRTYRLAKHLSSKTKKRKAKSSKRKNRASSRRRKR